MEIKMLAWIFGVTFKEKKLNEEMRWRVGIVCITKKIREARLRQHGHALQKGDGEHAKRNMDVYG